MHKKTVLENIKKLFYNNSFFRCGKKNLQGIENPADWAIFKLPILKLF